MREPASKDPWFKFYPADWQSDELLAVCSFGARGFLVELICLMHRASRYGYLLLNGQPPTDLELTRLLRGTSVVEVRKLKAELVERGVLSTTEDGVLFSRRMVRSDERSARARATGALGGNPALLLKRMDNQADNQQDNQPPNPHILEARSQKPEYVRTAAARRHSNNGNATVPTHRVLCAMARAEIQNDPLLDFGSWAEAVKRRLVGQGFNYPTGEALTAALDSVAHALGRERERST